MSINVTVNGNPISIRRGKMVLSDLENLKKTEREHRKRLRLEQVQEQSKALSKTLLERARQVRKEQLERLEKCSNTDMRRQHDKKLMELHHRYQDIENIGYAHKNAARQPDPASIREAEEQRNREKAKEREAEALERMKEAQNKVSPHSKHVERLRNVRELENERSNLVSHLPKKPPVECQNNSKPKPAKYVVSKKTPIKKTKITKTPSRISVSVPKTDFVDESKKCTKKSSKNKTCESDDNEPRKKVPTSKEPKRLLRIDIEKKNSNLISSTTTSSSSISEDSSYFSDNASKSTTVKKKSTEQQTSAVASKVTSYDHENRHKYTYERPPGLVERLNVKNKPNANDLAKEMVSLENQVSSVVVSQEETSNQRCQDALLREKIRRDYETLLKKLDELSKKEKKYEAEQCSIGTNQRLNAPSKRNSDLTNKQRKMDRVFRNILQSSRPPCNPELIERAERPITMAPLETLCYPTRAAPSTKQARYRGLFSDDDEEIISEEDNDYTRKRKISELLIKLEKMKRRLLQEYGTELPNAVFEASARSLFNNQPKAPEKKPEAPKPKEVNLCRSKTPAPKKKVVCAPKKTAPKKVAPQKTTCDQQVQVTLEHEDKGVGTDKPQPVVKIVGPTESHSSSSLCSSNSSTVSTDVVIGVSKKELTIISKDKRSKSVKVAKNTTSVSSVQSRESKTPVKICFDENNGNGSYQIVGLVIDTSMKEITVIPKKKTTTTTTTTTTAAAEVLGRDASPVITGSLPASRSNSPCRKQSTSNPPSRHSSPKKSPHQVPSRERRFKTQCTQVSNSSTESSSEMMRNVYRYQKQVITQFQDTSDASTAYPSPLEHGIVNASDNTNTILEFLDSSTNESLKKRLHDVSPVSSPETPSPRTMMVPSNVPRPGRSSKCLKFNSLVNGQTSQRSSRRVSESARCAPRQTTSRKVVDSETLKKGPEILKKYEDMQNVCAERIASLTDLIQKVRNEQKGLELSVITNKDSNSASQLPSSSPQASSNDDIKQMVKSVESLSTNIKKTLTDSRQIIAGEGVKLCEPVQPCRPKSPPPASKPKIKCDERVNIDLDRFKPIKRTCGGSDEVEIVEKSKNVDNKSAPDVFKTTDHDCVPSSRIIVKDVARDTVKVVEDDDEEGNQSGDVSNMPPEFISFLDGIPKVSRAKGNSSSARGRPPVTLISGPYRQEMDINSPAHELSTIVEFDTPDTAKKSQVSAKSPSNKVRKKLPTSADFGYPSPPKSSSDHQVTKSKPSVHVAPLPAAGSSPQLKSFDKSSSSPSKKKGAIKGILKKGNNSSSDSMHSLPDVLIENLQTSRDNTDANYDVRVSQISEMHSLPDENIEQLIQKKTTTQVSSTSSTSFSGLSGVSEISTTPSSDPKFKCPSSPEDMEQALKKWGLGWGATTLKKTREASALGSSSSSDGTPVNTRVSPVKKQQHQDIPAELSDVSSISMKHANKSTERSVLVKGRTSTPNRLERNETPKGFNNATNSDGTVSTLGSFSSDLNIVVENQSADMTVPNISFSNDKL